MSKRANGASEGAKKANKNIGIQTKLFINNKYVDATSKKTFPSVNPATEEVIANVQEASAADVDKAVAAARAAFGPWSRTDGSHRRDLLLKLADLLEEHRDEFAKYESADNGKPAGIADGVDIMLCIKIYRYYAGWADKLPGGKTIDTDGEFFAAQVREPIGVVGQIIPWNFPLLMMAWKLGPALACGCTVVLKTSEKTPITGMMFGELIKQAGFPAGVVNILSGFGPTTGSFIARHMGVDKIAFTGSSAVGHKIVQMSAESNLKRVTLELGGKSPMIVCKDADLDQALANAQVGLFLNQGQCCCASSRILVEEPVYEKFSKMCVEAAKKRTLSDPKYNGVPDQGPQVDKLQFDKVLGYIEAGKKEGAKLLCGGGRLGKKGYYVESTVFGNVKDKMKIAKEEIFGPVMQLMPFKTVAEAIERANTTQYGLAAGVMSRDIGKAMHIAKQLRAGTVWINCYDNFDAAVPFGGYKESGWGREKGEAALDNYLETKIIQFPTNDFK